MEKQLQSLKNLSDKRLEEFREYCRDNKKYNLTSIKEILRLYERFERESKKAAHEEENESDFVDLNLDL